MNYSMYKWTSREDLKVSNPEKTEHILHHFCVFECNYVLQLIIVYGYIHFWLLLHHLYLL